MGRSEISVIVAGPHTPFGIYLILSFRTSKQNA